LKISAYTSCLFFEQVYKVTTTQSQDTVNLEMHDSISIDEMERFSLSDCKKFHKEGILLLDRGRYPRMHKSFQRFKSIRYLKKKKKNNTCTGYTHVCRSPLAILCFLPLPHVYIMFLKSFNFHNGEVSLNFD
jgi:hypothetical protein